MDVHFSVHLCIMYVQVLKEVRRGRPDPLELALQTIVSFYG